MKAVDHVKHKWQQIMDMLYRGEVLFSCNSKAADVARSRMYADVKLLFKST